jgi:hypothetical protein
MPCPFYNCNTYLICTLFIAFILTRKYRGINMNRNNAEPKSDEQFYVAKVQGHYKLLSHRSWR